MINESRQATRSEVFDIENATVQLESVSGDIEIRESTDGKCHIYIYADSENGRNLADDAEISVNGSRLSVRIRRKETSLKRFFNGRSGKVDIVLELPQTAALRINAVSADIELKDIVKSVDIHSVSGDVSVLRNPKTKCVIKTVSGDITTHTFSSCDYALRTISGDITVHVAPGLEIDVDSKSLSGDTESEIALSSGLDESVEHAETVTINATTVSGDIKIARN
ncbi:MAG: DUF4097 family beta strand repeat protein [Actinobacteria bacterium]|nr:DUF4097 family beta strand repeat protein [Actinomycetota bacterium]